MNVSPIRNEGDIQKFKEAAPNERGKKTGKNRKKLPGCYPGRDEQNDERVEV